MRHAVKNSAFGMVMVAAVALPAALGFAQNNSNTAPNPYKPQEPWAKTAMGRNFGSTIGINVDKDGSSMWIFDRCGGNDCTNSKIAPIQKFDASGKLVAALRRRHDQLPARAACRCRRQCVGHRQSRHARA